MTELRFRTNAAGAPILSHWQIDALAERLLGEYDGSLLEQPAPLDAELYAEHGLGLHLDYADLSHDGRILGMTVFEDGMVPIWSPPMGRAEYRPAKAKTVLLDNGLLGERRSSLYRFTLMHECGHHLLHREYYCNKRVSRSRRV